MKQVLEKTIELIKLDENNIKHLKFLKEIREDEEVSKIHTLWKGNQYLVYLNERIIGICSYENVYYLKNAVSISGGILKEYRDKGYGSKSLEKMIDITFENNEINYIILEIKYNNILSLKSAEKVGFMHNEHLCEIFAEEGYKYAPLSLNREKYYQNKEEKGWKK